MNQISQNDFRALLLAMGLLMVNALPAQVVENRGCPVTYNRNNGNGQYVSVFASNISPNSIYAQAALTSGNQGNFTFTWGSPVVNPPVINRSWVTSTSGVTSLNWTFGNNSNGSPFNPPGVPAGTDVKYTFYNNNLPTAGTISFEFTDPYDGRVINTCSYPLSNGSTSSGSLVSLAVTPPSGLSFSVNNPASNFGSNGRSVKPEVNGGGGTVVFSLQNNPAGVTIDNATGEVSWNNTIAPGNYSFTVKGSNGIEPDATAGMSLTVHSIPVVAAITGSNLVAVDSLVQLACTTPDGAWSTSDAGVATVTAAGRVKGVGVGRADISYTVTNSYGSTSTRMTVTVTETGISSGVDGGLESRSIGQALAERTFGNKMSSTPTTVNYPGRTRLQPGPVRQRPLNDLQRLLPDQADLGAEFSGYITSPVDILNFTNAADVLSVDYVAGGLNKAVAFCTKTFNGVYTHTKPVCDRLKGSELQQVDSLKMGGSGFLRFRLQPASGLPEYAISFSAGRNSGDRIYQLQSEWMTDAIRPQQTMYNFQLWSTDTLLLERMLENVLERLNQDGGITPSGQVKIPQTYITRALRDSERQLELQLSIRNNTAHTQAVIMVSAKANEQSGTNTANQYRVSLVPFGNSIVNIPVKDMAEAEIRLMVNGVNEDFVYSNDGIWNIYATPDSRVEEFSVENDQLQPATEEYRLFRNVTIRATTPDYVTVYRMLKGGSMAADLGEYPFLKFTASGTSGSVRIRLLKKSVTRFSEQAEYLLPLLPGENEYAIALSNFRSPATGEPVKLNDAVIVSFTYESAGQPTAIRASLKNVRFAGKGTRIPVAGAPLMAYPSPAADHVNLLFNAATAERVTVCLISAATGQLVFRQMAQAVQGVNSLRFGWGVKPAPGFYIIRVQGATRHYQSSIIIQP